MSMRIRMFLGALAIAVSGAACATSVETGGDDLFSGPGDDGGGAATDAGSGHHYYDSAPVSTDDATASGDDASNGGDTGGGGSGDSSAVDSSPAPIDSATGPTDCPSNGGKYTLEYLAAQALAGEGGAGLPSCPCSSGQCCYTPPGGLGTPACLPL